MPFLEKKAKQNLTNTGALVQAHQLDFIGGDEGGHHRKQLFYLKPYSNPRMVSFPPTKVGFYLTLWIALILVIRPGKWARLFCRNRNTILYFRSPFGQMEFLPCNWHGYQQGNSRQDEGSLRIECFIQPCSQQRSW